MAKAFHAGDDFLSEIAPLGETDAIVKYACLGRKRICAEVEHEEGRTRLDAGNVERVPPSRAHSDRRLRFVLFGVGENGAPHGGCMLGWNGDFKPRFAGAIPSVSDNADASDFERCDLPTGVE